MTHWKSQFDHSPPKKWWGPKNARYVYMVTRLQAVCFDFQYGCHKRVSNEYSSIGYVSFLVNFSVWSGTMFLFIRNAPSPELQLIADSKLNADLAESRSTIKLCSNECCPYTQSLVVQVRLFAHSLQSTVLFINDAIAHCHQEVWGKLIVCYKLLTDSWLKRKTWYHVRAACLFTLRTYTGHGDKHLATATKITFIFIIFVKSYWKAQSYVLCQSLWENQKLFCNFVQFQAVLIHWEDKVDLRCSFIVFFTTCGRLCWSVAFFHCISRTLLPWSFPL